MIPYADFAKLDVRVAEIKKAERVEGSEKLVRLEISLGDETHQIVAGIAKEYPPDTLIGRQIIVLANLEPKQLMGLESNGMLLAADSPDGPILLTPDKKAPIGAIIK